MTTCSRTSASPSSSRLTASTRPRAKETGVDPFIAEIRIFPFNFAPQGWAQCNGHWLPTSQYTALFSLIGVYYGGNGTTNFALPNLQGSSAMHWGQSPRGSPYDLGQKGGEQYVTLNDAQMPPHPHTMQATSRPADLNG